MSGSETGIKVVAGDVVSDLTPTFRVFPEFVNTHFEALKSYQQKGTKTNRWWLW
jgi:hypothetical protein